MRIRKKKATQLKFSQKVLIGIIFVTSSTYLLVTFHVIFPMISSPSDNVHNMLSGNLSSRLRGIDRIDIKKKDKSNNNSNDKVEARIISTDVKKKDKSDKNSNESVEARIISTDVKKEENPNDSVEAKIMSFQRKFPLKLGELESIVHPESEVVAALDEDKDKLEFMDVPKFWDPLVDDENKTSKASSAFGGLRKYLGNFGERLMTLKEARSIGSFARRRKNLSTDENGDDEWLETIYVAIASYRDFQCPQTVESIFARAKYPERVRVSIVDQLAENEEFSCHPQCSDKSQENFGEISCQYLDQIHVFTMDAGKYGIGPVFARHIGHRMYRGEYFTMQIDAHVDFIKDWDELIVKQWKSAKNEMAVLTAYQSDVTGSIDPVTYESKHVGRPIMCKSDYEGLGNKKHFRHGQQPEGVAMVKGQPMLHPFWAAGFSFARGHFPINVPYDQHLPSIFQGEEMNIGVRAFTMGYDFYTVESQVCFHYYAVGGMGSKRKKVPLFFNNFKMHDGRVEEKAMERLNSIILARPSHSFDKKGVYLEEIREYGLGKVRTPEKFYETFGINTEKETVEDNLCQFVGKPMHYIFLQQLRDDTMGIDYSKINYKFVDPKKTPGQRNWKHLLPVPESSIVEKIYEVMRSKGKGVKEAN